MTKKRQIVFSLVRGLVAICIALLVAMLLIFISAEGATFAAKLKATGEALRQLLLGGGMIAALAGIGNAKVNAAGQGQHKQHGQHTGTRPGIG